MVLHSPWLFWACFLFLCAGEGLQLRRFVDDTRVGLSSVWGFGLRRVLRLLVVGVQGSWIGFYGLVTVFIDFRA